MSSEENKHTEYKNMHRRIDDNPVALKTWVTAILIATMVFSYLTYNEMKESADKDKQLETVYHDFNNLKKKVNETHERVEVIIMDNQKHYINNKYLPDKCKQCHTLFGSKALDRFGSYDLRLPMTSLTEKQFCEQIRDASTRRNEDAPMPEFNMSDRECRELYGKIYYSLK